MESKGRIGVIIPQISSNIDTQFVDVIHRKALNMAMTLSLFPGS